MVTKVNNHTSGMTENVRKYGAFMQTGMCNRIAHYVTRQPTTHLGILPSMYAMGGAEGGGGGGR